jgi:ribosomal protein S18 acetylase RimI-like enzyme
MNEMRIEEWRPESSPRREQEMEMLAEVLHATVHAGASVNFVLPFPLEEARAFWRDTVVPAVRAGSRRVLIARFRDSIAGTVQLALAHQPNQRHRAEVTKLLVHPKARRRGIGRALMESLERVALAEGRTLLTLDTRTGDAAEPLYRALGYVTVGVIPRYSRAVDSPELESTTILYKELPISKEDLAGHPARS